MRGTACGEASRRSFVENFAGSFAHRDAYNVRSGYSGCVYGQTGPTFMGTPALSSLPPSGNINGYYFFFFDVRFLFLVNASMAASRFARISKGNPRIFAAFMHQR